MKSKTQNKKTNKEYLQLVKEKCPYLFDNKTGKEKKFNDKLVAIAVKYFKGELSSEIQELISSTAINKTYKKVA